MDWSILQIYELFPTGGKEVGDDYIEGICEQGTE